MRQTFKLTLTDQDGVLLAQWEVGEGKDAPDTCWRLDSAMVRLSLLDQIRMNMAGAVAAERRAAWKLGLDMEAIDRILERIEGEGEHETGNEASPGR